MSITVDAANAPAAKLPLWPTVRLAYASYFQHFGDGLKIAALWLPPVAGIAAVGGWLQASLIAEMLANPRGPIDVAQPAHLLMVGYARNLLFFFAAMSGAVAWHRLLLLNEVPGFSGGNIGTRNLWRYIGAALLICVIAALPLVVVLLPMGALGLLPSAGSAPPAEMAVIVLAYFIGLVLMIRLSLLLPARATGNVALSLKGAWQRSRGNTWRLLGGIILCTVPPFLLADLIFVALTAPFGSGGYLAQWAAASAIAIACWLLVWPIWVGFLSHAYRQLVAAA